MGVKVNLHSVRPIIMACALKDAGKVSKKTGCNIYADFFFS